MMARVKPLIEVLRGVTRFGRLTVLGDAPDIVSPSGFAAKAACVRCDCGVEKVVRAGDLKNGYTTSCGCFQREITAVRIAERSTTHGKTHTNLYRTWSSMKSRCSDESNASYQDYGARGIVVCDRWLGVDGFANFRADVGEKPTPNHSLDRIDNDGPYSPDNVRWATIYQQCNNRRSSRLVTVGGETMTVVQWSEKTGVPAMLIYQRLNSGWDEATAVTTAPLRKGVKRGQSRRKAA